jgi:PPOX class probable F420-dependent enzyme
MSSNASQLSRAQFAGQKYISLMTFRKNGQGVATPVWFAEEGEEFFVYSEAAAGKIKRIRNNPHVRIAPCDMRGRLRGEWVEATARILEGEEAVRADNLLNAKYTWQKRLLAFFAKFRPRPRAYLAIRMAVGSAGEGPRPS